MNRAGVWVLLSLWLFGCGSVYIEGGAGIAVGATEPDDISVGPVLQFALGMEFDGVRSREAVPLAFGVGAAGDAVLLGFGGFDDLAFQGGIGGFVDVPLVELDGNSLVLRWATAVQLGGGGVRHGDVVEPAFVGSLFTGLQLAWGYDISSSLKISLGSYGLGLTRPGAYGGGMLRIRFGFLL